MKGERGFIEILLHLKSLFHQGMSFSPNKHDFERGMEGVVSRLEEALLCIKPLVMDPLFYPFTRPVLYGKQEDHAFKVNFITLSIIIHEWHNWLFPNHNMYTSTHLRKKGLRPFCRQGVQEKFCFSQFTTHPPSPTSL